MFHVQHMIKNGMEFEEIIFQQLHLVCLIHGMDINYFFLKANNTTSPQTKTKIRLLLKHYGFNTCGLTRRIAKIGRASCRERVFALV